MLGHGLRSGLRSLRRYPVFALGSVSTLAIGIGAATAMFGVVNGVFLEPLPYASPERLIHVRSTADGEVYPTISYPDFSDVREEVPSIEAMAVWQAWAATLIGTDGEPSRESGASVSASFFDLTGAAPAAGRFFDAEDGAPGHAPVVVLSYALWRSRFGGETDIVGRTLDLEGEAYRVVGVAPEGFVDPVTTATPFDAPDLWRARPPVFDRDVAARSWRGFWAIGRLAPGRELSEAQSELTVLAARLEDEFPDSNTKVGFRAVGIAETLIGPVRPAVTLLATAVLLVLLVACANVANLLLSRAFAREKEIAVRRALGASRRQILSQLVVESLVLSCTAAVVAFPVAIVTSRVLVALAGESLPRAANVAIDLPALVFAGVVGAASALLFGLAPAAKLSSSSLLSARSGRSLKGALVAAEVGVATALLIVAGLLLASLRQLGAVETGIVPESLLTFRVTPSNAAYPDPDRLTRVLASLEEGLRTLPGVSAVGGVNALPFTGRVDSVWVWRADRPEPPPGERPLALARAVTPEYFRAMGIALVRGRAFDDRERRGSPRVVIINETLARQQFGEEDPIGESLVAMGVAREIVGVVADVTELGRGSTVEAAFYSPMPQESETWLRRTTTLVLRVQPGSPPDLVAGAARDVVRGVDPSIPVHELRTMESFLYEDLAGARFRTVLLTAFAVVTASLAFAGIVSVLGFSVSLRRKEIALRVAVGAKREQVLALIVTEGAKLIALGAVAGGLAAAASGSLLRHLLFDVSPLEPTVYAGVLSLLIPLGLAATLLPASRATRIDPAPVLRGD